LNDAIRVTLAANPSILAQRSQLDGSRGGTLLSHSPYDLLWQTQLGTIHDHSPLGLGGPTGVVTQETKQYSYALGVSKLLPIGVTIAPVVQVTRTELSTAPGPVTGLGSVKLNVTMPLWQDLGGRGLRASVRAAGADLDATEMDLQNARSTAVVNVVTAYWSYRASQLQLTAQQQSEARALRIADETRRLVEADERPPSDLDQVQGNLAAKRASRIASEESVVETRQQLGLLMGLSPAVIDSLPPAATDFPDPPDSGRTEPASLVADALSRRPDLIAAAGHRLSAQYTVDAAENTLAPRLDLSLSFGYAGIADADAFGHFFQPLFRHVSGLSATVQLNYQQPLGNRAARGQAMQAQSIYDRQVIAESDIRRRVVSGVVVAAQALEHARLGLAASREAERLAQRTVESEERKFALGMSTLFDVIQAQDALTNAQLSQIGGRRSYAAALARLRFETASLVGDGSVDALTPP
jgi:outer membrane protein